MEMASAREPSRAGSSAHQRLPPLSRGRPHRRNAPARSRPPPRPKAASRPPSPAPATNRHRIARCAAILMVETFARRHFSSEALAFGEGATWEPYLTGIFWRRLMLGRSRCGTFAGFDACEN
jgi:hypothetical protein